MRQYWAWSAEGLTVTQWIIGHNSSGSEVGPVLSCISGPTTRFSGPVTRWRSTVRRYVLLLYALLSLGHTVNRWNSAIQPEFQYTRPTTLLRRVFPRNVSRNGEMVKLRWWKFQVSPNDKSNKVCATRRFEALLRLKWNKCQGGRLPLTSRRIAYVGRGKIKFSDRVVPPRGLEGRREKKHGAKAFRKVNREKERKEDEATRGWSGEERRGG